MASIITSIAYAFMPMTGHFIIKARRNYFENYASNEEISERNEAKSENQTMKNATKDFSETI
jgi:hypothetical protein